MAFQRGTSSRYMAEVVAASCRARRRVFRRVRRSEEQAAGFVLEGEVFVKMRRFAHERKRAIAEKIPISCEAVMVVVMGGEPGGAAGPKQDVAGASQNRAESVGG